MPTKNLPPCKSVIHRHSDVGLYLVSHLGMVWVVNTDSGRMAIQIVNSNMKRDFKIINLNDEIILNSELFEGIKSINITKFDEKAENKFPVLGVSFMSDSNILTTRIQNHDGYYQYIQLIDFKSTSNKSKYISGIIIKCDGGTHFQFEQFYDRNLVEFDRYRRYDSADIDPCQSLAGQFSRSRCRRSAIPDRSRSS